MPHFQTGEYIMTNANANATTTEAGFLDDVIQDLEVAKGNQATETTIALEPSDERGFIKRGMDHFVAWIESMIRNRNIYISLMGYGFKIGKLPDGSWGVGVFYREKERFISFKNIKDAIVQLWRWLVATWKSGSTK
jgi:hypothetical protein